MNKMQKCTDPALKLMINYGLLSAKNIEEAGDRLLSMPSSGSKMHYVTDLKLDSTNYAMSRKGEIRL